jgi:hypothetical protein
MTRWRARPLPPLRRHAVEWADGAGLLLARRNVLYAAAAADAAPRPLARIPAPGWKAIAARLRPLQRLLRFQVYNVLRLPDGSLFVTFDRSIGVVRNGSFRALAGVRRPCRVLRAACALAADGSVYFGEYLLNPERGPVHVYRCAPGSTEVEIVHSFPAGSVRHVHGIYRDPYTDALWCLSGDRGDECRFTTTADGFRSVDVVGCGDESWRGVSLQFTREHVYYATDAEFERNHLYRLARDGGRRQVLGEIGGPVYYSHAVGGDLFFAVSAELCPGQTDRAATLWHVSDSEPPSRVVSFVKDALPVRYFQAGILNLSRGPGDGAGFYFQGQGLAGADNRTFRVERDG